MTEEILNRLLANVFQETELEVVDDSNVHESLQQAIAQIPGNLTINPPVKHV